MVWLALRECSFTSTSAASLITSTTPIVTTPVPSVVVPTSTLVVIVPVLPLVVLILILVNAVLVPTVLGRLAPGVVAVVPRIVLDKFLCFGFLLLFCITSIVRVLQKS